MTASGRGRSVAIVPAAGASRRMGTDKLVLPVGDGTLIGQVLRAWLDSSVSHVIVVVRDDQHEVIRQCLELGGVRCTGEPRLATSAEPPPRLLVLVASSPPPHMKDSVQLALQFAGAWLHPNPTDAWLLAPADAVGLSPPVIDVVLAAFWSAPDRVHVPVCGGRRGHPVALPWSLAGSVATLAAGQGVNAVVAAYPPLEICIADDGILRDVDTPDDYRRLGGAR